MTDPTRICPRACIQRLFDPGKMRQNKSIPHCQCPGWRQYPRWILPEPADSKVEKESTTKPEKTYAKPKIVTLNDTAEPSSEIARTQSADQSIQIYDGRNKIKVSNKLQKKVHVTDAGFVEIFGSEEIIEWKVYAMNRLNSAISSSVSSLFRENINPELNFMPSFFQINLSTGDRNSHWPAWDLLILTSMIFATGISIGSFVI